jgi:Tfp pilus assembly protein PilF
MFNSRPVAPTIFPHSALAGIRDALALARLPKAEQKKWQALWAEVEAVFARAESLAQQADEYLAFALAYQRLGEKDKARLAYSKAVVAMLIVSTPLEAAFAMIHSTLPDSVAR